MQLASLSELYQKLGYNRATVYVVPTIADTDTDTSYLCNLYAPLQDQESGYLIRSLSFWGHLRPVFRALFSRKVILHYHWLEFQDTKSAMGMPFKLFSLFLFRLLGGTLVWTIHNQQPHSQKFKERNELLYQRMCTWAHAIHVHCRLAEQWIIEFAETDIQSRVYVLSHPEFKTHFITKEQALKNLEADFALNLNPALPVWLIFGQISPYKQIPELLESILRLNLKVQVIVAGTIKKDGEESYRRLISIMEQETRFKIIPKWIHDEQLPALFNAASLCLFNYRDVLSSGAIHLAMGYGKTVVAPRLGCIQELEGANEVLLFDNQEELDRILLTQANRTAHE